MRAIARHRRWRSVALGAVVLLGCSPSDSDDTGNAQQAIALADQEDEVCGMLVREQSAPRGQVVHRDGSHFFFCSLGDLLVHLGAPSPHGRAVATFVEVMAPGEDPMQAHTDEHPWAPAEDAIYVVGVERPGIMGEPALAYADRRDAELVIRGHPGARIVDLAGLREWWKELEAAL